VAIAAALSGALAGVVAKWADGSGIGWAAGLGTYPAVWILIAVVVGRTSPAWIAATTRAAAFFASMVTGYYLYSWAVLGFGGGRYTLPWLVASVTLAPPVALIGHAASHGQAPAVGIGLAGIAATVLVTGSVGQILAAAQGLLPPGAPIRFVQGIADAAVAGVVVGIVPAHRRTRLWALGMTLPAVWLLSKVVPIASGVLW